MNRISFKMFLPLGLGIVGIMAYIGYFIVKDSGGGSALDVCTLLPPVCFFSGMIAAIMVRRHRAANPALWRSGFLLCLTGTVLYAILILLLICAALAMRE